MNQPTTDSPLPAIIAAAGLSRRMGESKQLLPWGERTIIEAVVDTLTTAGSAPVICVIGHEAAKMRSALRTTAACIIYNSNYEAGEMLSSYQAGLRWLIEQANSAPGTLLALSDQPHVPSEVVRQVCTAANQNPDAIVIPSYRMRRGHPIYLPRRLWAEVLTLPLNATLRAVIRRHETRIHYVTVNQAAIIADLDTPEDYQRLRPRCSGQ
jgi:molybdenum cofactor cytidylyltransferase